MPGYPDGMPAGFSNQFASQIVGTTSTGAVGGGSTGVLTTTLNFNFGAGLMKVVIDSGGPAYVQLNGNTASTADYKMTSGDLLTDWYNIGVPFSRVSLAATSTALNMRVGAWG